MVSFNVYKSTASGTYVEGVCLATDEKPIVGIANGSILYAVDASDGSTTRYMYDQPSMSWVEAACPCSGGGSGGSGPNIVVCELDVSSGSEVYANRTVDELMTADYILFRDNLRNPWQLESVRVSQDMSVQFVVSGGGKTATLTGESPEDYPEGTMESGGSGGGGSVVHCPLTVAEGSRKKLKAGMTFDELAMADQIIFDETDAGLVVGTFVCVAKGSNSLAIAYPNGKGKYEIITLTPDDEGYPSATVSGGVS